MTQPVKVVVLVEKAEGLLAMDANGKSDPYVKVTFRAEGKKGKSKSTSTKENSLEPVWNENIDFVSENPDADQISVRVYDKDVTKDDAMCEELTFPISEFMPLGSSVSKVLDLVKGKKKKAGPAGKLYVTFSTEENTKERKKKEKKKSESGADGEGKRKSSEDKKEKKKKVKEDPPAVYGIHVRCVAGRNLVKADLNGTSDPYLVISCEGYNKKAMCKCVENTVDPDWGNEELSIDGYDVDADVIKITVMDKDGKQGSKKDDAIGVGEIPVKELKKGFIDQRTIPLYKCDRKGKKKGDAGDGGEAIVAFHIAKLEHQAFVEASWDAEAAPEPVAEEPAPEPAPEPAAEEPAPEPAAEEPAQEEPAAEEPAPEPETRDVEVEPVVEVQEKAKKSSSSSSSDKKGKCSFSWGSYSSSYSTSFSGYTDKPEGVESLSDLHESEEGFHIHKDVEAKEPKEKLPGLETLSGTIVEGKDLFQIDGVENLEAYLEVKLVGKNKDKKGKEAFKTDVVGLNESQDATWNKEFDFQDVKKGQAVAITLFMKHSKLDDFEEFGQAKVQVKNIEWDHAEPVEIELEKGGFFGKFVKCGKVYIVFNHHNDA